MAMEQLGRLRERADADGTWDLVVVDTPPSRSALDFLDAPARLGSFLDGRLVRLLTAPARAGGRIGRRTLAGGMSLASATLGRLLGTQLLADVGTFVQALDTTFGGFRERAAQTYARLTQPGTAFVVVTTPAPAALQETDYLLDRLREQGMPLAGVVVNRTTRPVTRSRGASGMLGRLAAGGAAGRTAEVLLRSALAEDELAARDAAVVEGLRESLRRDQPGAVVVAVPSEPTDVHDLDGLRRVAASL